MSGTTRTLDTITRIYKNADGDVLGIHCVEVVEEKELCPTPGLEDTGTMEDRAARVLRTNKSFTRANMVMGSSRVVATVQMLGSYDDFELNGSSDDIDKAIYFGGDGVQNESYVAFNLYPTVGSTL